MIDASATVDGVAVQAFNAALQEYAQTLGNMAHAAPQLMAIRLCKSFRAATPDAKKRKGLSVVRSSERPAWITYRRGQKLAKSLRRWTVTLTDRNVTFNRFVYSGSTAAMKRELRDEVGTNYYPVGHKRGPQRDYGMRGLAKRSWGWVMRNISISAAPDDPWRVNRHGVRRPKKVSADSYFRKTPEGGVARIANRLDYIEKATHVSPDAAATKAASGIIQQLAKPRIRKASGGMSSADIRAEAKAVADAFIKQFEGSAT